jgi:hypothetical protein
MWMMSDVEAMAFVAIVVIMVVLAAAAQVPLFFAQ